MTVVRIPCGYIDAVAGVLWTEVCVIWCSKQAYFPRKLLRGDVHCAAGLCGVGVPAGAGTQVFPDKESNMLNFWVWFWGIFFFLGLGLFSLLSVAVIIGGFFDILALLRGMRAAQEEGKQE